MNKVVIFGTGQIAELAHYYFKNDSEYEVLGFTVDAEYINSETFCGLPIYDFECIEKHFSNEGVKIFVALSYAKMNKVRESKIKEAKKKGFTLASYISSKATIFGNVRLGEHCFILENNTIQPFVKIGDNNILWSGNHIGHHSKIGNHNFFASQVVVSGNVVIDDNCFIGVNATIRDGIHISNETLIGAGSYISKNTSEKDVYKTKYAELSNIKSDQVRI